MKQGEVLMKERERRKISPEEMAGKVGLPVDRYLAIEAGNSPAERWGPAIRELAVALQVPTSRMFATSGKSADTRPGQAAELIRGHRETRKLSAEEAAGKMGLSPEEYAQVESGSSEIEEWGPFFLRFAESLENGFPVFNLFHPFGLPFEKLSLEDYR
ncbi:MAG TPA: helix-turn-helix transcriptional regulator [Thermoanaerobaculia bacterium]|nr:helix-turn-helix transcriptional regulator [Thermoanaerobaculia bacterium]